MNSSVSSRSRVLIALLVAVALALGAGIATSPAADAAAKAKTSVTITSFKQVSGTRIISGSPVLVKGKSSANLAGAKVYLHQEGQEVGRHRIRDDHQEGQNVLAQVHPAGHRRQELSDRFQGFVNQGAIHLRQESDALAVACTRSTGAVRRLL
ncbi:hypothetical protein [Demequina litorisediminis]|uniref:hypothetical protein n=1 Tax=Demequina litorisediminis TaxID=1849022 RepID=UPI0024E073A0|nr:hypothetical protein [Demequina litorisediminis]